jgi:hypothetical protein
MTFKERIFAAWNGQPSDHVPLTTWCFGLKAPPHLRWRRDGREVTYWYSKRMEHIHTLPQPWTLEDDFARVQAWHSLGVDDVLELSVPWSVDPEVTWQDSRREEGGETVLVREYQTPSGPLRHEVRQTGEDPGAGWVVQPDHVPLIEDYNIPRGVKHAVASPADVAAVRHLLRAPDASACRWFVERMVKVKAFADTNDVPVQAWSAFGMDGIVWMTGVEGAIMMAMDEPQAFGELVGVVAEADLERTRLAASTPGVDMIVERGWYSSTDFWSPRLFDRFVYPHVEALATLAHEHGVKFGYVMTTGVEILGPRLADAGVDVLYFCDPIQDGLPLERARDLLSDRMTLVGGTNALSLAAGNWDRLDAEVYRAIAILGPTRRFILHPVDAVFPDTTWEGIERLIACWEKYR